MLPLTNVFVEYKRMEKELEMAVSDQIPTLCLIGTDLTKHVQSALILTRAQSLKESGNSTETREQTVVTENGSISEIFPNEGQSSLGEET